jgi:hypothetical protein
LRVTARFAMLVASSSPWPLSAAVHYSISLLRVLLFCSVSRSCSIRGEKTLGDQYRLRAKAKVRATCPQAACLHFFKLQSAERRRKQCMALIEPLVVDFSTPEAGVREEQRAKRAAAQTCQPELQWAARPIRQDGVREDDASCSSQCKATSRTHARTPGSIPSSRASSAVGRLKPWRSTRTAKRPLAWMRAVSEPRSRNQGMKATLSGVRSKRLRQGPWDALLLNMWSALLIESRASDSRNSLLPLREKGREKRGAVMTFMIWGISTCHDRYCGRGDLSIPAMRVPGLIPLLANQSRFISSA